MELMMWQGYSVCLLNRYGQRNILVILKNSVSVNGIEEDGKERKRKEAKHEQ